jgi:hypothetical protein
MLWPTLHLAGVREADHKTGLPAKISLFRSMKLTFRQIGSKTPGHPESHLTTGWKPRRVRWDGIANRLWPCRKMAAANYHNPASTLHFASTPSVAMAT